MLRQPHRKPGIVVAILMLWSLVFSFIILYLRPHDWHLDILSPGVRRVESHNFQSTAEENKCFTEINILLEPVPNIVHFVWGFKNPELNFMNYLAIRSALIALKPDTLKVHYQDLNRNNIWFQKLQDNITLVHHDLEIEYPKQIQENWKVAHLSDMLRLDILQREGGIYLDADVISLPPFDTLRYNERGVILGNEGGDRHGLCNAVIIARKDGQFLNQWIESYNDFSPKEWNYHSVLLPKEMAAEHPDQVCSLAPTVFFWPTWTHKHIRYMHEPLTPDEAWEVENLIDANGGSLYPDQLAYHAWNQVARAKYLDRLTPEIVKQKDTRFNILVRRFL